MKAGYIADELEKLYPPCLAEKWDNPGFLCGNRGSEIKKILVALDASLYVVGEAVVAGANMIVTHHPIMFSGVKNITMDTKDGQIIYSLIKNNISLFAAHTNLDESKDGINRHIAYLIGLENLSALIPNDKMEGAGTGVIGSLSSKKDISVSELVMKVKKALGIGYARFTGSSDRKVRRVAVITGSGGDYIYEAAARGAEVLITGDIKYHTALDADFLGLTVIDAGHYGTEIASMDIFANAIQQIAPDVEVIKSSQKDIFSFM